MTKKVDIESKQDLEKLVRHFYEKTLSDPIIGFFFTQVSPIDLDEHTPKIAEFWNAILFGRDQISDQGSGVRMNNMLKKHSEVDGKARMQAGHFTRWLFLFSNSIDELYEGENAEKLKKRSKKMASSMSDALRTKRGESRIGVKSLN